jgi:integrase/recombinase XerD
VALGMIVADVYRQHRRLWARLHEKGGKEHSMPCRHHLETYLQDYIEAARLAGDREGQSFRGKYWRTGILTDRPMTQSDAWRMVQRRGRNAGYSHGGLQSHLPCHGYHHLSRQWRLP